MTLEPIGTFFTDSKYPYEARRQASVHPERKFGEIRLHPNQDFEQALIDLEGFERIWILYHFHQNLQWKPMVMPPRGPRQKRGVFATRAPYRPNALGLSCVRLVQVEGLRVVVAEHDLLDETPVFDLKPYLPYADAFPDAKIGWLEDADSERWQIEFSPIALRQLEWLEARGVIHLRGFIFGQLEFSPLDHKRKRVTTHGDSYRLAYRTWRVDFRAQAESWEILVVSVSSGYSSADLEHAADIYEDKDLHRGFLQVW